MEIIEKVKRRFRKSLNTGLDFTCETRSGEAIALRTRGGYTVLMVGSTEYVFIGEIQYEGTVQQLRCRDHLPMTT